MIHLTEKDYAVSRWSGGTTTQIALFPPESSYAGRDFLWRVSSAVVEDGESAFTPLPDCATTAGSPSPWTPTSPTPSTAARRR